MKKIIFCVFFLTMFFARLNSADAIILLPDTGNYYDFIRTNTTWDNAKTAAESMSYLGISGHLATITSSIENNFLNTSFNTGLEAQFAWIGGWEPADDRVWLWAVGPEAGIQFSNDVSSTAPFNYANWGGIEPNDNKPQEDFAMFNIGLSFASINPGQWADASPTPSSLDPVIGYLVEFETKNTKTIIPEPSTLLLLGSGLLWAFKGQR